MASGAGIDGIGGNRRAGMKRCPGARVSKRAKSDKAARVAERLAPRLLSFDHLNTLSCSKRPGLANL
jgi:hypothetical protein